MTTSLSELLSDPSYSFLLEETAEEAEISDKLFDMSRYENTEDQSLEESLDILGYEA